jgi:hypothetical protein
MAIQGGIDAMRINSLLIISLLSLLLSAAPSVSAQSEVASQTRQAQLRELAESLKARDAEDRRQVRELARQLGIPERRSLPNGGFLELQRIAPGIGPIFYQTYNVDAADTVSTDEVWPGGTAGLNLEGAGMTVGEWDGGAVDASHSDLAGRVVQVDGVSTVSEHSTHVAGTLIGAGEHPFYPQARGMAYAADLDAYDWNSDTAEMATAAANGLLVSNHSYGIAAGWLYLGDAPPDNWWWIGGADPSDVEDANFGYYDSEAQLWDQIAQDAPYYLIVKAGGNDRWDTGPAPGEEYTVIDQDGNFLFTSTLPRNADCAPAGYDCLPGHSVAKNILTIGAVDDLPGGYSALAGPSQVQMGGFSGWGPTDDGRIKPDLVGNGIWLVSTWPTAPGYAAALGTSMATPNVTGSLLLLQEHFEDVNGNNNFMRAATLKALAIHTADEAGGADGPDYAFGWGLLNTQKAAKVITEDGGDHRIVEDSLPNGGSDSFVIDVANPDSIVRATLVWADPPGTPAAPALDPTDLMLVNDLDLRLTRGPSSWLPWVLNPANPAAPAGKGDNFRDNVEQVVAEVSTTGSYTVEVSHKGTLASGSSQDYSLILSVEPAPSMDSSRIIDEDFSGGMPAGWSVNTLQGDSWTIQSPVPGDPYLDNQTGGSGPFAMVNNYFTRTQTSLVPPTLDLSSATAVVLSFDSSMLFSDWETINVDISTDGGGSWTNVWYEDGLIGLPHHYVLDLTGALAGQAAAALRFRYYTWGELLGYYWQIDNVLVEAYGVGPPPPPSDPPAAASEPFPADAELEVELDTVLNWAAGSGADSHDVYLGTGSPPTLQGNQGGTGFDPGPLQPDTTYHWRIDEVNAAGTTEGSEWTFTTTTATPPPPPPPSATDIHLKALTGASIPQPRNRWNASVTVEVADDLGAAVVGALVEGDWSAGTNGGASCTTGAGGLCSVQKNNLKGNVASVAFTVTNLSGTDMNYDATANETAVAVTVYQDGGGGDLLPDARNDSFSTPVDTVLGGNVMDNDDEGDAPASVTAYDVVSVAGGSVTMADNGQFSYAPPAGWNGSDSFGYTISDSDGDSDSALVTVTVEVAPPPPPPGAMTLTVTTSRSKGSWYADLSWSGADTANVDIFLNDDPLATVSDTGAYSHELGRKPGGEFRFRVCETDGDPCAEDAVQF